MAGERRAGEKPNGRPIPEALRAAISVADLLVKHGYLDRGQASVALDLYQRGEFEAADRSVADAMHGNRLRKVGS